MPDFYFSMGGKTGLLYAVVEAADAAKAHDIVMAKMPRMKKSAIIPTAKIAALAVRYRGENKNEN
jgi:hypothetical protein